MTLLPPSSPYDPSQHLSKQKKTKMANLHWIFYAYTLFISSHHHQQPMVLATSSRSSPCWWLCLASGTPSLLQGYGSYKHIPQPCSADLTPPPPSVETLGRIHPSKLRCSGIKSFNLTGIDIFWGKLVLSEDVWAALPARGLHHQGDGLSCRLECRNRRSSPRALSNYTLKAVSHLREGHGIEESIPPAHGTCADLNSVWDQNHHQKKKLSRKLNLQIPV